MSLLELGASYWLLAGAGWNFFCVGCWNTRFFCACCWLLARCRLEEQWLLGGIFLLAVGKMHTET
uniref:Uncharacterized protein n=1 Tax=Oryza brachyantha TaxID=4533 RepID=J3M4I3_ORYBR